MTKAELDKLKGTVAYFSHWYDVIGEERVLILEKSIKYIADLEKENAELKARVEKHNADILLLKHLTEGQREQLTKAKVALRNVIDYLGQFCSDYPDCVIEAEKILKKE